MKNQRLAAVGHVWAFAALTASPGARKHYDRRKDHGDRHTAALRNLCNRFLGCLFWCLTTRQTYQEHAAFPPQPGNPQPPEPHRLITVTTGGFATPRPPCRSNHRRAPRHARPRRSRRRSLRTGLTRPAHRMPQSQPAGHQSAEGGKRAPCPWRAHQGGEQRGTMGALPSPPAGQRFAGSAARRDGYFPS